MQQETALQRAAFKRAGVARVVEEKRSGGSSRPLLDALLLKLRPGDTLYVYKIDRLARSLVDLLRILQRLADSGVSFVSLTEPLETQTPVGRMMLQLLGAVAEFERAVIRERCAAGRAAALDRGVQFGRRPTLDRAEVIRLRSEGLSLAEVSRRTGHHSKSVRSAINGTRRCDGGPGTYQRTGA